MRTGLTRIVDRAHELLAPALRPGDLAVDLTAGSGRDTLFLARRVGAQGTVLAFDIQGAALDRTAALLTAAQLPLQRHAATARPADFPPGIHLLHAGHQHLADYLPAPPQAIVANLGYLPGGDHAVATAAATTRTALAAACTALARGGRIAVAVYVGHPGGAAEGDAVAAHFAALPPTEWQVLRLTIGNIPHAPFLLIAERR